MNITAPSAALSVKKKPLYKSLFFQILVAVAAGIVIGHFWPDIGAGLRPLGDGFIQLIKMIIAPLIFLVIVTGIAAVSDVKAVGRVGIKALVYFTAATLFALVFGLVVGNLVQPGAGLNIDPASLSQDELNAKTATAPPKDAAAFLLGIIRPALSAPSLATACCRYFAFRFSLARQSSSLAGSAAFR